VGLRARLLNGMADRAGKVVKNRGDRVVRTTARVDLAERVTPRGSADPGGEQVPLEDQATVQSWLRRMGPDETVLVHRAWGTIAARSHPDFPTGVFLSDGANAWYAVPPVTVEDLPLTKVEVEHIVLEAMTSQERPTWPRWVELA
jgi:hypothetical protein